MRGPGKIVYQQELEDVNKSLEKFTPEEIIRWAWLVFGSDLGILTSFGKGGCLLCHKVIDTILKRHENFKMDLVFVDTDVHFSETIEVANYYGSKKEFNRFFLKAERTIDQQIKEEGLLHLTQEGQKKCCRLRKRDVLKQILAEDFRGDRGPYTGLLVGLLRKGTTARLKTPILQIDAELNLFRIHPFANVAKKNIEKEITENNVYINRLHGRGYASIGCSLCTTVVREDEDERAGRWRHLEGAKVCNINPIDREEQIDHMPVIRPVRGAIFDSENLQYAIDTKIKC